MCSLLLSQNTTDLIPDKQYLIRLLSLKGLVKAFCLPGKSTTWVRKDTNWQLKLLYNWHESSMMVVSHDLHTATLGMIKFPAHALGSRQTHANDSPRQVVSTWWSTTPSLFCKWKLSCPGPNAISKALEQLLSQQVQVANFRGRLGKLAFPSFSEAKPSGPHSFCDSFLF